MLTHGANKKQTDFSRFHSRFEVLHRESAQADVSRCKLTSFLFCLKDFSLKKMVMSFLKDLAVKINQ
jgi:hypothetical protein